MAFGGCRYRLEAEGWSQTAAYPLVVGCRSSARVIIFQLSRLSPCRPTGRGEEYVSSSRGAKRTISQRPVSR